MKSSRNYRNIDGVDFYRREDGIWYSSRGIVYKVIGNSAMYTAERFSDTRITYWGRQKHAMKWLAKDGEDRG